jgi:serine/threonine-protein kinase HipA
MTDFNSLDIYLHDKPIGQLTNLPGDRNLFSFNEDYVNDANRAVLSLSFKDAAGELITDIKTTRTRLPSFFANLLPEGHMRQYLASQANVKSALC